MRGGAVCIAVREELDVFDARRAARRLALDLDFPSPAREELVLVISELGWNIVKYGVAGDITLEAVESKEHGIGIRATARDIGPPITNLALAILDGNSDRGPIDPLELLRRKGFGGGLGAVVRLTDSFEYRPGVGEKRISVVRYARRPKLKRGVP